MFCAMALFAKENVCMQQRAEVSQFLKNAMSEAGRAYCSWYVSATIILCDICSWQFVFEKYGQFSTALNKMSNVNCSIAQ
jgi:hypothetical protein